MHYASKLIWFLVITLHTKFTYKLPKEGRDDRYRVPKFHHSSATFNIILGFCILASPKVLQGASVTAVFQYIHTYNKG